MADAFLLASARRIVWEETYRGIYPDEMLDGYDVNAYAQRDAERIADPRHHFYLFLDAEECAGYFSYGPCNFGPYKDFDLCLNNLYIRKTYQGRGLGRQAFAHVWKYCAEQGLSKFFCGCNFHNHSARAFYTHMGGVLGEIPVLHDDKSDDIVHFEFYVKNKNKEVTL